MGISLTIYTYDANVMHSFPFRDISLKISHKQKAKRKSVPLYVFANTCRNMFEECVNETAIKEHNNTNKQQLEDKMSPPRYTRLL